jgi:hypothetical protein
MWPFRLGGGEFMKGTINEQEWCPEFMQDELLARAKRVYAKSGSRFPDGSIPIPGDSSRVHENTSGTVYVFLEDDKHFLAVYQWDPKTDGLIRRLKGPPYPRV